MKFTNEIKVKITEYIAANDKRNLIAFLYNTVDEIEGKANKREIYRFIKFLKTGRAQWSIFADNGNEKLPFLSFSSLAGESFCVGAGDCLNWCYSFKAWRYPAAFFRQCQNAILLQSFSGQSQILFQLDRFKSDQPIDFRLYVDGDFRTVQELEFWQNALIARPWLRAYGYSKSWQVFLNYQSIGLAFADNYKLNISSGSKYGDNIKQLMKALPVTRGEFVAVSIGRKVKSSDHGTKETNKALRDAYNKKAFTCTGLCGSCTPKGHACGSDKFNNIDIIIAVH